MSYSANPWKAAAEARESGLTRALEAPPYRRYRGRRGRRAYRRPRTVFYDLLIILGVWSISAYPILWVMIYMVGPWLHGATR